MLEMKLSDKFNSIYELEDVDNKGAIVREIKALKNFTDDELSTIFDSSNILWILENYSVKELKDRVKKVAECININIGDIIKFKYQEAPILGVVLSIAGKSQDRCTALCYYQEQDFYKIIEGISFFDVDVISNSSNRDFKAVIDSLGSRYDNIVTTVSVEGDL
jgi:hypothetical protein